MEPCSAREVRLKSEWLRDKSGAEEEARNVDVGKELDLHFRSSVIHISFYISMCFVVDLQRTATCEKLQI